MQSISFIMMHHDEVDDVLLDRLLRLERDRLGDRFRRPFLVPFPETGQAADISLGIVE